ncbi:MAG: hypothetical protein P4L96_16320 [Rhodoferax sp.]|nr:hypothetical protein [Rhodoferax sp.]
MNNLSSSDGFFLVRFRAISSGIFFIGIAVFLIFQNKENVGIVKIGDIFSFPFIVPIVLMGLWICGVIFYIGLVDDVTDCGDYISYGKGVSRRKIYFESIQEISYKKWVRPGLLKIKFTTDTDNHIDVIKFIPVDWEKLFYDVSDLLTNLRSRAPHLKDSGKSI